MKENYVDVYLINTIIKNPQKNYRYHINDPALPGQDLVITFSGFVPESWACRSLDLIAMNDSDLNQNVMIKNPNIKFIFKNDLPEPMQNRTLPLLIFYKKDSNQVVAFNKINIHFIYDFASNYQIELDEKDAVLIQEIKPDNKILEQTCSELSGKVPVSSGSVLFFMEKNKPGFHFLRTLFDAFMDWNTDIRLEEQNSISVDWCAARAHLCAYC